MRAYRYIFSFLPALLSFVCIGVGGIWSGMAPLVIFGVIPLIELVFKGSKENFSDDVLAEMRNDRSYDYVLYSVVVVQYALLGFFLYRVTFTDVVWWEIVGMTISMGMCCGILGINVGHELGHRRKKSELVMAYALLVTSLYTHFNIEHNRGHHALVATRDDPATARFGEWLWLFIPRSAVGGYFSAWGLEKTKLARKGRVWTWDNIMIRLTVLQVLFVAAIFAIFGWVGGVAFIGAAAIGGILLETVNYIEHYGLEREIRENGTPVPTGEIHSWNANAPLGRLALFELSRHSDHHAHARRKYQTLRHFEESPQMPTGYPGMMVLAWIPPLWFAVVHRHMRHEQQRVAAMGKYSAMSASLNAPSKNGKSLVNA